MFTHTFDECTGVDTVEARGEKLVIRRRGAEVIGLAMDHRDHGRVGLIWRDGEVEDPASGWRNHATILFPVVGGLHGHCSRTTDGTEVRFRGLHGLARHATFALARVEGRAYGVDLEYVLDADDETRAAYPFDFRLSVTYGLRRGRLEQAITAQNRGDRPMPFQVGWHPGFNTPFVNGEKRDCHLRLPAGRVRRLFNDPDCRLTGESVDLDTRGDFRFTDAELDATYMLDISASPPERRVVELLDPDESIGVRVHLPDYPHLGLWSDTGAPFICIEPWQGMDDHVVQEPFDRKFGIRLLDPGASEQRRASIEML